MATRSDYVESPELDYRGAVAPIGATERDVDTTTRHVRRDRNHTERTRFRDQLGLSFGVARVQELRRDAPVP